jgi:hypothetical protein
MRQIVIKQARARLPPRRPPKRIVLQRLGIHRLLQSPMHRQIRLLIAKQPHRHHRHNTCDSAFADGGKHFAARGKQGYSLSDIDRNKLCAHNMCENFDSTPLERQTMNITLSVDERVAENAREAARKMGKSLNQAVRDYLEQLGGQARREQEIQEFLESCKKSEGRLNGWKFNRDEANER